MKNIQAQLMHKTLIYLILFYLGIFNLANISLAFAASPDSVKTISATKEGHFLISLAQTRMSLGQSTYFYIFIDNKEKQTLIINNIEINSDRIKYHLIESELLPLLIKDEFARLSGKLEPLSDSDFESVFFTIKYQVNGESRIEQIKMPSLKVEKHTFSTYTKGWETPINFLISMATALFSFWYGRYAEKKKMAEACLRELQGGIVTEIDTHLRQIEDISQLELKLPVEGWSSVLKAGLLYALPDDERIKIKRILSNYYDLIENYNATIDFHQRGRQFDQIRRNAATTKECIESLKIKKNWLFFQEIRGTYSESGTV